MDKDKYIKLEESVILIARELINDLEEYMDKTCFPQIEIKEGKIIIF